MARGAKRAAVHTGPVEGPWELPDGWCWERLQDIAEINPKTDLTAVSERPVTFLGMVAVSEENGRVDVSVVRPASQVAKGFTRFQGGDVLFAKITPCMENGKIAVVPELASGVGAGSTEFHVVRSEKLLPKLLFHFLVQRSVRQDARRNMTGTAGQMRVPTDYLRLLPVPVPPPDTQKALVARIDELFAEIDGGELALAAAGEGVETFRQALLKSAVTGELTADWRASNGQEESGESLLLRVLADRRARWTADPKNAKKSYPEAAPLDSASLPALPVGWVWTTVEHLTTGDRNAVVIGPFGSDLKVSDYTDEGVPLVFVRHIRAQDFVGQRPQHVSPEKAKALKAHEVARGDLLVTKMGDPPGDVAIYPDLVPAIITADCIRWRPHPLLNNEFLAAWVSSFWGRAWIAKHTKGVAQQKITLESFKAMPVALPGPNEQSAIVAAVKSGFAFAAEIDTLTDTSAATTLRQAILAAAFHGDLVA